MGAGGGNYSAHSKAGLNPNPKLIEMEKIQELYCTTQLQLTARYYVLEIDERSQVFLITSKIRALMHIN